MSRVWKVLLMRSEPRVCGWTHGGSRSLQCCQRTNLVEMNNFGGRKVLGHNLTWHSCLYFLVTSSSLHVEIFQVNSGLQKSTISDQCVNYFCSYELHRFSVGKERLSYLELELIQDKRLGEPGPSFSFSVKSCFCLPWALSTCHPFWQKYSCFSLSWTIPSSYLS